MQDIFQTWLTPFVDFSCSVESVKAEHLQRLRKYERADVLYAQVKPKDIGETTVAKVEAEIRRLTIRGIFKYGG